MRFFGKRVALNKYNLRSSIIQITKDLKDSIKIDLTNEDPNLSGEEINELTENTFNMHYQDVKYYEFLNRRTGMKLLYEEEIKEGEYIDATLYFKVTPEALSKLKRHSFDDAKYTDNGYLPNGEGPIDHLFIITVWKKGMLYKALTMTEEDFRYPEYLLPYINLLHKRVQLGFFSSDSEDKPLMDHYFGKQKRHPRSRKLRQSRSRKLRHSRSRK
jgi:hypothetical protein